MIDWERLEQEMADLHRTECIADRIVRAARRQRARRGILIGTVGLAMAAAVAVPVVVAVDDRARPPAAGATRFGTRADGNAVPARVQAAIYAAALSGADRPVWVRDHVCNQVPRSPAGTRCRDAPIPPVVQREVADLLNQVVRFAPNPRVTATPPARIVVGFGPLHVNGDTARVGMETVCGGLCGQGETLVLRVRSGRWQVTGSVGPRWVS